MQPSIHPPQGLRAVLYLLLVFMAIPVPAWAQENERKVPTPPPRVPVRPVGRPVPIRPQPQVQRRPEVRRTVPAQRVQPGVNRAPGQVAAGQRRLPMNQLPPGRGGNPAQNRLGERTAGGVGTGNFQRGGFRLPPNARSVAMPGGSAMVVHPDGRRWLVDKNNHVSAFSQRGMQAKFYGDGRVSSVHVERPGSNLLVARGMHGGREAVSLHAGGVVVVTYGRDHGYVQRPLPGRMGYFERTSLVNGQPTARVYRAYRYRGIVYFRYQPAYSYQPGFYQWAGSPWPTPATYNWSWQQSPWAASYSSYFTPSQTYPSAASWLTDFVLAANLQSAYQSRQENQLAQPDASAPNQGSTETAAVSPEVKNAIALEVQAEVTEEQSDAMQSGGGVAAANGQLPPPALDPNQRTFVVSQNLDAPLADASCALTPGDVIYRSGDLAAGNKVPVTVVASKAGDCPANTSTQIEVATLQEMHNQFQQQVDSGLTTLTSSEGSGGLPAGPVANGQPVAAATVSPDPDVAATLAQQQSDADSAEAAATNGASGGGSTSSM